VEKNPHSFVVCRGTFWDIKGHILNPKPFGALLKTLFCDLIQEKMAHSGVVD
jgi:hypothetical protein